MRQKKIDHIVAEIEGLQSKVAQLASFLGELKDEEGRSFDIGQKIPERDSSVAQILARIQAASGIAAEFKNATRADMVPFQTLDHLQQATAKAAAAAEGLIVHTKNFSDSNGGLRLFNYSNFHFESKNGSASDLTSLFQSLFDTSETFLTRFFASLLILKPRGSYSFQAAASGLSQSLKEANEVLRKLQSEARKVDAVSGKVSENEQEVQNVLEEIRRLKSDGSADRKTVADYLAEVTQQRAAIQTVYGEAKSLQEDVEAYQSTFDQFKKQLDAREAAFREGTENLSSLINDLHTQRSEVNDLLERSRQMLSSATVSGLASNFSSMTKKLTRELWWARFAFYVGIAFLTVSALPLLAFVLLPVVGPFFDGFSQDVVANISHYGPDGAANSWQYLGQVLARIAVLLPAAWFVSFAAIRHSSLFRLREHYAYKYSMAVSVEGFKQQAPVYEQEIAALVLEQLAFNPADKLASPREIKESRVPGIAGYLLEKIRGRVDGALADRKK
ncbi:MAG: hypothetical protein KF895_05735 [Parvibaculum sp.]|nr:hypothetical protein [Parvibaculum sp.]